MKKISDLFNIYYGVNLELSHLQQLSVEHPDAIPFVSRTENNNGVSAFVRKLKEVKPNPKNTLSVAGGGSSVLSVFLQKSEYYSGRDLFYLVSKEKMTEKEMLYYAHVIFLNKYRFNYGRQANKTLPSLLIPEYILEDFKDINIGDLNTLNKDRAQINDLNLNINNWAEFDIVKLFKVSGSKTSPVLELEEYGKGKYPYVTTQATNNGIEGFYDYYTEDGGVITSDSAVIGYCAYQPLPFSASDHVEKLFPKFKINKYIAMFLVTVLNQEQYRYNYGRKCSQTRMRKIKIKLPAKNGKPDFEFMENYIKSLPYSSSI